MESEAVRWHRLMKEEEKQCGYYPGCTNLPGKAVMTDDTGKYRLCAACAARFLKEHPEIKIQIKK